ILYSSCTNPAGYQRQIFDTAPALLNGITHCLMPVFTRADLQPKLFSTFPDNFLTFDSHMQHQTAVITGQQNITAAAKHQNILLIDFCKVKDAVELTHRSNSSERTRAGSNVHRIKWAQFYIMLHELFNGLRHLQSINLCF